MAPLARRIVFSPVDSGNSAEPGEFEAPCRASNPAAAVEVAESLRQALELCAAQPFVVVTGSFYLVGQAMQQIGLAPAPLQAELRLNDWGTAKLSSRISD